MPRMGEDLRRFLRLEMMPSVWCPGCGHGNVVRGMATALERLHRELDQVVVVGGIGCAGRSPFYLGAGALHTTHGRALAFATGLKSARPDLTVLAAMGDGDAAAIGGNHFIHACRRNIDLTAVVFNNSTYGMTGGQHAPTAPAGSRSTTTPLGSIEPAFDIAGLALAAGASYVARTTTFDFEELPALLTEAIAHPGFAVVEVLSQCPTYFGRLNHLGDPAAMLDYERDLTFPVEPMTRDQIAGRMPIGVFRREIRPEFTRQQEDIRQRAALVRPKEEEIPPPPLPPDPAMLRRGRVGVWLSGEGGQGIILAGVLLADAGIGDGLHAVHTQTYGPEARGGACTSDVILAPDDIAFPEVDRPDTLVCLSEEAARKHGPAPFLGGVRILDEQAAAGVEPAEGDIVLPIVRTALETGGAIAVNVVALGALVAITRLVSRASLQAAARRRLKPDLLPLNERGLEAGFRLGAGARATAEAVLR